LVALNDPFLREPVLLLRDLGTKNQDAMRAFPDHRPAYFRLDIQLTGGVMKGGYGVFSNPDERIPGYVSLFEIGMALETARHYSDQDIFDFCYSEVFNRREAEEQWNYLQDESIVKSNQLNTYKDHFRMGIVHAARTLLIPKKAFERFGKSWKNATDTNAFRMELEQSETSFRHAGSIGQTILAQIGKARIRIDKNRDKRL
ncbi:MAG TPA: hypothetical protein VJ521_13900, partial [Acidobacteriota bacterium]|nr:hypothetical protein [Acidobacteriota bacterium]